MSVSILGIRHPGPGSARSVEKALSELKPDAVLIEGPPEAEPLLPLVSHPDMHPPVALLGYATDEPGRAAFCACARRPEPATSTSTCAGRSTAIAAACCTG